jgi:hypothetical protein
MDTLRPLTLTFLWGFACTPALSQTFNATHGSMVIHSLDQADAYTIGGPDFSAFGSIAPLTNPLDFPFSPGPVFLLILGDTQEPSLSMSLTLRGVPWSLPMGTPVDGVALAQFYINDSLVLTGPGTYSSTFAFTGSFYGAPAGAVSGNPGAGCNIIGCTRFFLNGSGTLKLDVVPYPSTPGALEVRQAAFTFVPTPSTVSLMLLGLVALGFQAWGRMRLEQRVY